MSVVICPFCGAKDVHESPGVSGPMILDVVGRVLAAESGSFICRACRIEFAVLERALDGTWVRLPK